MLTPDLIIILLRSQLRLAITCGAASDSSTFDLLRSFKPFMPLQVFSSTVLLNTSPIRHTLELYYIIK